MAARNAASNLRQFAQTIAKRMRRPWPTWKQLRTRLQDMSEGELTAKQLDSLTDAVMDLQPKKKNPTSRAGTKKAGTKKAGTKKAGTKKAGTKKASKRKSIAAATVKPGTFGQWQTAKAVRVRKGKQGLIVDIRN
jgi:mannose-6-phosphate isomerase-like protein (cupin superfamily)